MLAERKTRAATYRMVTGYGNEASTWIKSFKFNTITPRWGQRTPPFAFEKTLRLRVLSNVM